MEKEIDQVVASLKNYLKDSSQKTHKSLIDSLSSLTVHLDRGEVEVCSDNEEERTAHRD